MAVKLNKHDLEFILKQIEISEVHSAQIAGVSGADATSDIGDALRGLVDSPLLPYGLRTVDGSYNNLVPGREQWGSSGEPFPRITTPTWRDEQDDAMPPGYVPGNNNNYGNAGDVVDADPRLISNLIVDQTLDNPAAIAVALRLGGTSPDAILSAVQNIHNQHIIVEALPQGTPAYTAAKVQLDTLLAQYGIELDGPTILMPNRAPDEGLSASYNSWFTLFGQFFDHGLDLVSKGGNGTVYIPLSPDDPLYNPASPHTNFMVLTRASTGEGAANVTTPWVDQNQTYTSHASHQVFLREYVLNSEGKPVATGHLLEGATPKSLATWKDVKDQAKAMLGIELTDADVGMVPLIRTDPYGKFIPDPDTGFAQLIVGVGADGIPNTADDLVVSGTPANPVNPTDAGALRIANAFLDDIAHSAATINSRGQQMFSDHDDSIGVGVATVVNPHFGQPVIPGQNGNSYLLQALEHVALNPLYDPEQPISAANPQFLNPNRFYDNELLDAHFITGDGRGNENIGLTAVHFIFHAEHNRQVDQIKTTIFESGDLAFINAWLVEPVGSIPPSPAGLIWNGERLFQAARFSTEMQYQHLVFEEFARKVQPDIDIFMVQPDVDLNPDIFAEFAHVVYRFGHSMLNETVDRIDANGDRDDLTLFEAFLNPLAFGTLGPGGAHTIDQHLAAGAIVRGMTAQVGNEIDEFVTNVLRNQLVGIPLDLAAINIARGRDTGMPTLNEARAQFKAMAGGDTQLDPYASWSDFAVNINNPESIVNFIAAYGTHDTITSATTTAAKRDAAMALVFGGTGAPVDRLDFLNGRGTYAGDKGGLDNVDLWIGGLAEKKMPFGGMLGSTFAFIFELQMEKLQHADRFYYLSRVQGLNLLTELENNSLAKMVMTNTDLGASGFALPGDIFSTPDHVLYVDFAKQMQMTGIGDPTHDNPFLQAISALVDRSGGANFIRYNGADHVVIAGTEGDDHIIAGGGDDTVWGFGGNDRIEAGYGVDKIMGGDGDDIITNSGTDIGETDMLHGEGGNDVIHGGSGMALIFGGSGQDFLMTGPDGSEIRGGQDNDFILGGNGHDMLFGNEGNDWIEGDGGFEYIAGDNGELFFNSTVIGHDVLNGGSGDTDYDADSGDDIMFAGDGIQKFIGMWGHDWVIYKGQQTAALADMNFPVFPSLPLEVLRDRFSQVEGLSGWKFDDVLRGDDRTLFANVELEIEEEDAEVEDPETEEDDDGNEQVVTPGTTTPPTTTVTEVIRADFPPDPTPEGNFIHNELDEAGIARIQGLDQIIRQDMLRTGEYWADGSGVEKPIFVGGNILLGGGGSDFFEGRAGDDVIDGDAWLNVRIRFESNGEAYTTDSMAGKIYLETAYVAARGDIEGLTAQFSGRTLDSLMLDRTLNPGQLEIKREIFWDNSGVDTAYYWDVRENYTITQRDDGRVIVEHHTMSEGVFDPITGKNRTSDGTDTLYNVERIEFGDGTIVQIDSAPASALIVLTSNTNGNSNQITADVSAFLAANPGLTAGALTFAWTFSPDNGTNWYPALGSGQTFTVGNEYVGYLLRATVSWEGGSARSLETAKVGNNSANTLDGTSGPNLLVGRDGADILNGSGGDDVLLGGSGNDTLTGGAGNDTLYGGAGTDIAAYAGPVTNFNFSLVNGNLTVTDLTGAEGTDTLFSIENLRFSGSTAALVNGSATGQTHAGSGNADIILAHGGNDTLNGGNGADILVGGAGNDTVNGGAGNDTILWRVGDGRDFIDGGGGSDTVHIAGNSSAETFYIYTLAAWLGISGNTAGQLNGNTEIVIARGGTNNASIIAELDNVEEIVINGFGGGDTFVPVGNFAGTSLAYSTITLEGGSGNDTVDITGHLSAHRIVFKSNGGHDTVIGAFRAQDSVELPAGSALSSYQLVDNGNGTKTFTNGSHSITFSGDIVPNWKVAGAGNSPDDDEDEDDDDLPSIPGRTLDDDILETLRDLIRDGHIRDSSGNGNNVDNPTWGTAGHNFIRLTDAHYTDGASGIRTTELTPREISNIISNQDNDGDGAEESIPNPFNGSALLTFFGQYFDHGLDFVAKGAPGSVAIGTADFPINAGRSNIVEGTGVDPDGIPNNGDEIAAEYVNKTSPYVDQNQAYGSHNAVTDLLRKWEAGTNGPTQTAYLLTGYEEGDTGRFLLPTLDHVRDNYRIMTNGGELTAADIYNYRDPATGNLTNQSLLIDFIPRFTNGVLDLDAIGNYYIAGDGRLNENVMLTSIHTIWARNHNFWVDKLKFETGGAWSEDQYFEAARIMNIAEYQRVVFTEFAEAIAGGLGDDDSGPDSEHGFNGYDPNVDASISIEFAHAAFRFGHSMLNETLSFVNENGEVEQMSLVDVFLSPQTLASLGIEGFIAGASVERHQAIDVDMVNALRNQLVGQPLDLAALNIFRGRDMGLAPFNEIRAQLYDKTGLSSLRPYSGWDDFQSRNEISNDVINQLKAAYPGGFHTMDLWVGGLAEKARRGQLGSTFAYIFLEQLDRLQHGDRFYYLEILDDSFFEDNPQTFADIIMRNTGLTGLPSSIFTSAQVDPPTHGQPAEGEPADPDETDPDPVPGDEDENEGPGTGNPDGEQENPSTDPDDEEDNTLPGEEEDEDHETPPGNGEGDPPGGDDDDDQPTSPPPPSGGASLPYVVYIGSSATNEEFGSGNKDLMKGNGGDDLLFGLSGDDILLGGDGNDRLHGGDGNDILTGGAGNDELFGGDGHDVLHGGSGDDVLFGGDGDDVIFGEDGNDHVWGQAGADIIHTGAGDDTIFATVGDGNDHINGGSGSDTLVFSGVTANVVVDLGLTGVGWASSAQTGFDTLFSVENVVGGAGNDTIYASTAVNVLNGGAGNDTFVFRTAASADGDRIEGFHAGDKIDLSPLYAGLGLDGPVAGYITNEPAFNLAGNLFIRTDGTDSIIEGSASGDGIDFSIRVVGHALDAERDFV